MSAPRLALLALLAGCTSSTGRPASMDGGSPPSDAGPAEIDASRVVDSGRDGVETRSVTAGPFSAPNGAERTQCVSFDVGNELPMFLVGVRTHLTPGSHHMIVYRLDEPPDARPRPCGAFSHGVSDSIFIAQQREAAITYPRGTGLRIEAHQTIGLEIHYINYVSDAPIDIAGTVELDLVPADGALEEMHLLFDGDLSLTIPARSDHTATSFHAIPSGARIFALTSHTHQLGTRATIHRATSETAPGELLHESTSWAEPPLDVFDPMLVLDPGEGLLLTCEYHNPTDEEVGFGLGFDDEMCFLWAHIVE
jgi:hypothetical protein